LRDYPMPFFEEPMPPGMVPEGYPHDVVTRWREKVKEGDGFIFVTPEYNHGYSAVLKNALDYVYYDWSKKTVAFVSWGGAGGVRAVEQLRLVAVEVGMAPTRNAVHIPNCWAMLDANGKLNFESFEQSGTTLLDQRTWWARTLKEGRAVENL